MRQIHPAPLLLSFSLTFMAATMIKLFAELAPK
jgi:hypothetical protein